MIARYLQSRHILEQYYLTRLLRYDQREDGQCRGLNMHLPSNQDPRRGLRPTLVLLARTQVSEKVWCEENLLTKEQQSESLQQDV